MSSIFASCKSLKGLPDISEWKTNNVKNIECLFQNCSSLVYIPSISKWNIKTNKINNIFEGCSSLLIIPDISKWQINNGNNDKKEYILSKESYHSNSNSLSTDSQFLSKFELSNISKDFNDYDKLSNIDISNLNNFEYSYKNNMEDEPLVNDELKDNYEYFYS